MNLSDLMASIGPIIDRYGATAFEQAGEFLPDAFDLVERASSETPAIASAALNTIAAIVDAAVDGEPSAIQQAAALQGAVNSGAAASSPPVRGYLVTVDGIVTPGRFVRVG